MDALIIDAFEFCRLKESRQGSFAVSDLPRLAAETATPTGAVKWSITGGANGFGHPQLELKVSGSVPLLCQRCLTPFEFIVDTDSTLVPAKDDASADHIENLIEDETIDVIVGSHEFDLAYLIEDEALLALPLSPRHEHCEAHDADQDGGVVDGKKPSPFAEALKGWKR